MAKVTELYETRLKATYHKKCFWEGVADGQTEYLKRIVHFRVNKQVLKRQYINMFPENFQ